MREGGGARGGEIGKTGVVMAVVMVLRWRRKRGGRSEKTPNRLRRRLPFILQETLLSRKISLNRIALKKAERKRSEMISHFTARLNSSVVSKLQVTEFSSQWRGPESSPEALKQGPKPNYPIRPWFKIDADLPQQVHLQRQCSREVALSPQPSLTQ